VLNATHKRCAGLKLPAWSKIFRKDGELVAVKKLPPITESEWNEVCEFNRRLYDEFLTNSVELSPKSLSAYHSSLRIWFVWVKDNLDNKRQVDIKPLEFKQFQNAMVARGCSSSDCANKRAAISSLNNYIIVYHADSHPTFHNFINKSIARPARAFVNEKEPLTKVEFSNLITGLEKRQKWQEIAYLKFTLETGCRRAESRQALKSYVDIKPVEKDVVITSDTGEKQIKSIKYYVTPNVRCKGRGTEGKIRKFRFGQETMDAFKKWLEVRGTDDCPYMFVSKQGSGYRQIGESGFNTWASGLFTEIVGRRFHPHIIRESAATQLVVEDGKDISIAQKLLGHESSETTQIYVIRDESEDLDELFI
jgi:integrase